MLGWFGRFNIVVQNFGLNQSKVNYSIFYRHQEGKSIYLIVYVDDIVIMGDYVEGILFNFFRLRRRGSPEETCLAFSFDNHPLVYLAHAIPLDDTSQ